MSTGYSRPVPFGVDRPGKPDRSRGARARLPRLALIATCLVPLATGSSAQDAPLAVAERFGRALKSGDRAAVLACLAPEVVIFEHGEAELSRDEYASHHLDGDLAYLAEMDVRVVDRKVLDAADRSIVMTRTESSGQYKGKPVASRGTETLVLERRGDRWLIVHVHWSSGRSSRGAP